MESDVRPWGNYIVLMDHEKYKVKIITVKPGGRLSLQYHHHRKEHWFFLKGKAKMQLGNNNRILREGDSIDIALKELHRVENIGDEDLVFIETQTGESFDENDIVRVEDDYDRK